MLLDRRLLSAVRRELRTFIFILTAGGFGAAGAIVQAYFLTSIIAACFLQGKGLEQLWSEIGCLIAAIVFRAGCLWLGESKARKLAEQVKEGLRQRVLRHIFALGPVYAGAAAPGELLNTVTTGIENLEDYFAKFVPGLAMGGLIPIAIVSVAFPVDWESALLMTVTAPLIPFFMMLIGRQAAALNETQWAALTRLSVHLFDVLQGLTTLKVFGRSREQIEIIGRLSDEFRDKTLQVLRIAFLSALVLELVATLSTALIAVSIGLKLLYGFMTFEQALFVLLITPEFYLPLRELGSYFHASLAGRSAADQIYRILAQPKKRDHGAKAPLDASDQIGIEFRQVNFSYEGHPALQDFSFVIPAGQKVALVGPSGSGKTTLFRLLLKFIRPDSGKIYVNGQELSTLSDAKWLERIAYVPQTPHLFSGTIAENICFGLQKNEAEIVAACKAAQAAEFIEKLPLGYHTEIGEGGQALSGGQAQRLALARAFLKDAPCLLLDEATAGLDVFAADGLRRACERLMEGRTVLMIAHRLSSISDVDRILVLREGQLVEQGSHQELMEQGGVYNGLIAAYRRDLR